MVNQYDLYRLNFLIKVIFEAIGFELILELIYLYKII